VKKWSLLAGWFLVLVLATTLTWQIVSAADDQVSDRPIAPLNVAAPVITEATSTSGASSSSTSVTSPTSVAVAGTSDPTVPSTEASGATDTPAAEWQTRSVETEGGTLLLRYRPDEVTYQTVTPAPGFQVEVGKQGPPEVEVEFESESQKIEVQAAWRDGDLDVEVSESSED
jgi:cytoskeletal protein RodZ